MRAVGTVASHGTGRARRLPPRPRWYRLRRTEMAGAIAFLLSASSTYGSGTTLQVNGG